MRVNLAQIERRQENILVRESDKYGAVDGGVTRKRRRVRLNGTARRGRRERELRVRQVELSHPGHEFRCAGGRGCNVRVVRSHSFTRQLPTEKYFTTREGERDGAVVRDRGAAVFTYDARVQTLIRFGHDGFIERSRTRRADRFAGLGIRCVPARRVGLVDDGEGGKVLPGQTGLVSGAGTDVRGQQGPGP